MSLAGIHCLLPSRATAPMTAPTVASPRAPTRPPRPGSPPLRATRRRPGVASLWRWRQRHRCCTSPSACWAWKSTRRPAPGRRPGSHSRMRPGTASVWAAWGATTPRRTSCGCRTEGSRRGRSTARSSWSGRRACSIICAISSSMARSTSATTRGSRGRPRARRMQGSLGLSFRSTWSCRNSACGASRTPWAPCRTPRSRSGPCFCGSTPISRS
mmetsp:Transcript_52862/g.172021  ORF Transcript_52862/g.172021 Transcript_52862/m.172021 type:complete len:214 (+) Transcript_52862:230-871(+)